MRVQAQQVLPAQRFAEPSSIRRAKSRDKKPQALLTRDVMTAAVLSCTPTDPLDKAARIMWDRDCGVVPVVDEQGRVVGMLTDRDICMAAFTQGSTLAESSVASCMSRRVVSCSPEDPLELVLERMARHQVMRLPVTNWNGQLVGIVALSDVARSVTTAENPSCSPESLARALRAIVAQR